MCLFRNMGLQQVIAGVLLFTILNFSLNTINDYGYSLPEPEIESFTELLLEELLNIEGAIADTPENDQESSATTFVLFISKSGDFLLAHYNSGSPGILNQGLYFLYSSIISERETPPPQQA
ncbi:hypothetical protein QQ054_22695 [Oscillatoria amoena NRMC-F 0135]|nr:hypothetical protein [Oscillatoria amoena NRMC-F 0135]